MWWRIIYFQGVGNDWDGGEVYPVVTTLLRVLAAGEHLDERQHCFTLQIATENPSFPPNGARQQPITFYLNTETRAELIKVEVKEIWSNFLSYFLCSNFPICHAGILDKGGDFGSKVDSGKVDIFRKFDKFLLITWFF